VALTLEEIKARLKLLDELTLMELLGVSSEELVEQFDYKIQENYEQIEEEVNSSTPGFSE
jgi:hypothetical protein